MTDTPLSPSSTLALAMHNEPGVYALLLGSGVSTGAGIYTGWEIVLDLVRQVAALSPHNESECTTRKDTSGPDFDPDAWWSSNFGRPLGYSTLLEELAETPAARQALIANYIEPRPGNDEMDRRPSPAHRAVARLVARGAVRVVITTNFDRLIEQALEEVGIQPQVLSRPDAVMGMRPLDHAPATVIKLHGDYRDVDTLNTEAELATYPKPWTDLLHRIFDDYGLVISGWSAQWDSALRVSLEQAVSRRYPLYWDSRSSGSDHATRLLALRAGRVIDCPDADALFSGIDDDLNTLERLAESPLSTAMAVTRLKRYLPDPRRRVDVYDLLMGAAAEPITAASGEWQPTAMNGDVLQGRYDRVREQTMPLLQLLVRGVWHDDGIHDPLWEEVVIRLIAAAEAGTGGNEKARLWPALLVHTALGIAAVARARDDLLIRVNSIEAHQGYVLGQTFPVAVILHLNTVLDEAATTFPRWEHRNGRYASARQMSADLKPVFVDSGLMTAPQYARAEEGYWYRLGLMLCELDENGYTGGPVTGPYAARDRWQWSHASSRKGDLVSEKEFEQARFRDARVREAWDQFIGDSETFSDVDTAVVHYRSILDKRRDNAPF